MMKGKESQVYTTVLCCTVTAITCLSSITSPLQSLMSFPSQPLPTEQLTQLLQPLPILPTPDQLHFQSLRGIFPPLIPLFTKLTLLNLQVSTQSLSSGVPFCDTELTPSSFIVLFFWALHLAFFPLCRFQLMNDLCNILLSLFPIKGCKLHRQ